MWGWGKEGNLADQGSPTVHGEVHGAGHTVHGDVYDAVDSAGHVVTVKFMVQFMVKFAVKR